MTAKRGGRKHQGDSQSQADISRVGSRNGRDIDEITFQNPNNESQDLKRLSGDQILRDAVSFGEIHSKLGIDSLKGGNSSSFMQN